MCEINSEGKKDENKTKIDKTDKTDKIEVNKSEKKKLKHKKKT